MPPPNFKILESLLARAPKAREQFEPQAGQPRRIGVSKGQQKFEGNVLLGKNNVGDEAFAARLQQEVNKMPAGIEKLEAQRLVDSIFANREFSSAVRTNPEEAFAETSGTGALTRGVSKKPIQDPSYLRAKPGTGPTESNWEIVKRSPEGIDVAGKEGFYIFPEGSKRATDLGKQNFVTAREVLNLQRMAIEQLHNQGKGPSLVEFSRMAKFQMNRAQLTPAHVAIMEQLLKGHRGIPQNEKIFGTEQPQEVLDRMRLNRTGETETQPPIVASKDRDEIMADTKTTIAQKSSFDPNRKDTSNVLEQVATTLPGFKFTAGQGNTGLLHVTWDGQPEIPLKEAISNPKYKIPTETKQQLATLSKSLAPLRGEPDGSGGYIPLPEPNMHEASASQAKALIENKKQIEDPDNPSGLQITNEEERQQSLEENKSSQDLAEIRNKKKKKRYESTPPKLASAKQIAKLKFELEKLGDSSLQGEAQELMSRVGGLPSTEVGNLIDRIKQEQLGPDASPRDLTTAQLKFTGAKRATAERTLLSSMDKISKGKVSNFGNEISKLLDSFQGNIGSVEADAQLVEKFMAGLTPEKQSIVAERLMKHPGGEGILRELSKEFTTKQDGIGISVPVSKPQAERVSPPGRGANQTRFIYEGNEPIQDVTPQISKAQEINYPKAKDPRLGPKPSTKLKNKATREFSFTPKENPLLKLIKTKKIKEETLPPSGIFQESGGELKGSKVQTPSESWFQRIRAKLNDFIRLQPRTSRTQQTEYSKEDFEKLVASLKDIDMRIAQWAARDRPPR